MRRLTRDLLNEFTESTLPLEEFTEIYYRILSEMANVGIHTTGLSILES